ncbi:MAG: peptidylprolyl isomerase [Dehalococcoidia bacterium]
MGIGIAVCGLIAMLAAGCGSSNNSSKNSTVKTGATPRPAGTPRSTPLPAKPTLKAPPFTLDSTKGYMADIKTDKGDIIIELNAKAAPLTVNNFVFLARQHFYDGLTCFRVLPGFVAQCGDPKGDGTGGPGYTIPDEASPLKHDTGAIAMAKSALPNTAGSQFYITLAPQPSLDGNYTVFGQVISGQDVVNRLTPRNPQDSPPPAGLGDRMISITIAETSATPTPVAGTSPAAPVPAAATPTR